MAKKKSWFLGLFPEQDDFVPAESPDAVTMPLVAEPSAEPSAAPAVEPYDYPVEAAAEPAAESYDYSVEAAEEPAVEPAAESYDYSVEAAEEPAAEPYGYQAEAAAEPEVYREEPAAEPEPEPAGVSAEPAAELYGFLAESAAEPATELDPPAEPAAELTTEASPVMALAADIPNPEGPTPSTQHGINPAKQSLVLKLIYKDQVFCTIAKVAADTKKATIKAAHLYMRSKAPVDDVRIHGRFQIKSGNSKFGKLDLEGVEEDTWSVCMEYLRQNTTLPELEIAVDDADYAEADLSDD